MTETADPFDFMLDYTEPTTTTADHWKLVEGPPSDWTWAYAEYQDMRTGVLVYLYSTGLISIENCDFDIDAGFIDRLQSLKALARQHFGPEWGK